MTDDFKSFEIQISLGKISYILPYMDKVYEVYGSITSSDNSISIDLEYENEYPYINLTSKQMEWGTIPS